MKKAPSVVLYGPVDRFSAAAPGGGPGGTWARPGCPAAGIPSFLLLLTATTCRLLSWPSPVQELSQATSLAPGTKPRFLSQSFRFLHLGSRLPSLPALPSALPTRLIRVRSLLHHNDASWLRSVLQLAVFLLVSILMTVLWCPF